MGLVLLKLIQTLPMKLLQDQVLVWLIVVVSGGGAPSDGLTDVAGTSTNLTDTADPELYANCANTSATSASFPNTCSGSSGTTKSIYVIEEGESILLRNALC